MHAYGLLLFIGVTVACVIWSRRVRSEPAMLVVLACALLGAVAGAKLAYLAAELPFIWHSEHFWQQVLIGRTILGGMLGGYLGVELGKLLIRHEAPTGDTFAVAVPIGLALGRVGCYLQGCCLGLTCEATWYALPDAMGQTRYPITLVEAGFHVILAGVLAMLARRNMSRGQLFHLYLITYGLFRFGAEFLRDTPRYDWGVSPYALIALALVVFAGVRMRQRMASGSAPLRVAI